MSVIVAYVFEMRWQLLLKLNILTFLNLKNKLLNQPYALKQLVIIILKIIYT